MISGPVVCRWISFHDGQVTWINGNDRDSEIFLWDGSSVIQLTNDVFDHDYPQIHDGQVTWRGWDGGDYEIFLWDGSGVLQLHHTENHNDDDHTIHPLHACVFHRTSPFDHTVIWRSHHYNALLRLGI